MKKLRKKKLKIFPLNCLNFIISKIIISFYLQAIIIGFHLKNNISS